MPPFPHSSHLSVLCPNKANGGSRRKLPLMRQLRALAFCCLCSKAYFVLSLGVHASPDTRPFGVLVNPTFCQIRPTFCQACVAWSRVVPTETPTFWATAPPIARPSRLARSANRPPFSSCSLCLPKRLPFGPLRCPSPRCHALPRCLAPHRPLRSASRILICMS